MALRFPVWHTRMRGLDNGLHVMPLAKASVDLRFSTILTREAFQKSLTEALRQKSEKIH